MSSWSDAPPRSRILRGVFAEPANMSTVKARSVRDLVVDPQLVLDATEEGYQRGYDAGFQSGLADAAAAIDSRERARAEQLESVLYRLSAESDALAQRRGADFDHFEAEVVHAAFRLARELIGFELSHAEQIGRATIARALELAPDDAPVVVSFHPDEITSITDPESIAPGRTLQIVADPSLAPGDCVVDVGACRVESRLDAAVARVEALLAEHGFAG